MGVREKVIKSIPYLANPPSKKEDKSRTQNDYGSKKFWEKIIKELQEADAILHNKPMAKETKDFGPWNA